jgi:hypothetical protein
MKFKYYTDSREGYYLELVENKVFYHIQRRVSYNPLPFWGVGQTHFIGKEKNPFFKAFDYGVAADIGHYYRLTREIIFEEVRKEYFPTFPSRTRCLWVMPENCESIKYWMEQLNIPGNETKLLKLSLTGKIFKANQIHLNLGNHSLDTWRQKAFKYWAGASGENLFENEILFEGFATILEEINGVDCNEPS